MREYIAAGGGAGIGGGGSGGGSGGGEGVGEKENARSSNGVGDVGASVLESATMASDEGCNKLTASGASSTRAANIPRVAEIQSTGRLPSGAPPAHSHFRITSRTCGRVAYNPSQASRTCAWRG